MAQEDLKFKTSARELEVVIVVPVTDLCLV